MAFVNPGYLGNRGEFSARYDRADAPPHLRALLAAKLRPVLLRRTKQAVAPELPPRIEERRDCELTAEQRQLYLAELQRSRALLTQLGEAPGGLARNKITILAALTRLRQICCHPALAGGRADARLGQVRRAVRAARAAPRRGPQGAGVLAVRAVPQAAGRASCARAAFATTSSPARRPSASRSWRRSRTIPSRACS